MFSLFTKYSLQIKEIPEVTVEMKVLKIVLIGKTVLS